MPFYCAEPFNNYAVILGHLRSSWGILGHLGTSFVLCALVKHQSNHCLYHAVFSSFMLLSCYIYLFQFA